MNSSNSSPPLSTNIPPPNLPFISDDGRTINRVWWMFMLQLFRRTGSELGGDGQLTVADVLGLEAVIPVPIDLAAQVAELAMAIQQVQALAQSIQQSIPAFGEVFAAAGVQMPPLPDVMGAAGVQSGAAFASETTFARV